MNKSARFAFLALAVALLAACGAKGPLFLPEKPVPVEPMPAEMPATEAPTSETPEPADASEPPLETPATPPADGND